MWQLGIACATRVPANPSGYQIGVNLALVGLFCGLVGLFCGQLVFLGIGVGGHGASQKNTPRWKKKQRKLERKEHEYKTSGESDKQRKRQPH